MDGHTAVERPAPVSLSALLSRVAVDAGGVPAEWIEVTAAMAGQPTVVFFRCGCQMPRGWEDERRMAGRVALDTAARVLWIGGRPTPAPSWEATVRNGLTGYIWLLGEGVDLRTTAFMETGGASGVASAVLRAARARRLPLPARGVRSLDPGVLQLA